MSGDCVQAAAEVAFKLDPFIRDIRLLGLVTKTMPHSIHMLPEEYLGTYIHWLVLLPNNYVVDFSNYALCHPLSTKPPQPFDNYIAAYTPVLKLVKFKVKDFQDGISGKGLPFCLENLRVALGIQHNNLYTEFLPDVKVPTKKQLMARMVHVLLPTEPSILDTPIGFIKDFFAGDAAGIGRYLEEHRADSDRGIDHVGGSAGDAIVVDADSDVVTQLFVKLPINDSTVTISAPGDLTIGELKAMLEVSTSMPVVEQSLFYNGKPLREDEKHLFAFYNIYKDSTLLLQPKDAVPGGAADDDAAIKTEADAAFEPEPETEAADADPRDAELKELRAKLADMEQLLALKGEQLATKDEQVATLKAINAQQANQLEKKDKTIETFRDNSAAKPSTAVTIAPSLGAIHPGQMNVTVTEKEPQTVDSLCTSDEEKVFAAYVNKLAPDNLFLTATPVNTKELNDSVFSADSAPLVEKAMVFKADLREDVPTEAELELIPVEPRNLGIPDGGISIDKSKRSNTVLNQKNGVSSIEGGKLDKVYLKQAVETLIAKVSGGIENLDDLTLNELQMFRDLVGVDLVVEKENGKLGRFTNTDQAHEAEQRTFQQKDLDGKLICDAKDYFAAVATSMRGKMADFVHVHIDDIVDCDPENLEHLNVPVIHNFAGSTAAPKDFHPRVLMLLPTLYERMFPDRDFLWNDSSTTEDEADEEL